METHPGHTVDPFGDAASPGLYVAREATERALAELMACGSAPARPAALIGPPGIGKSVLLWLVGERLESVGTRVFIQYPALDVPGLCAWILDELRSPHFGDPVFAVEAYLAHLREIGSSLVLLVEDLYAMPMDTVLWLGERVVHSKGEVRLIATAVDGERFRAVVARLGPGCEKVLLEAPMEPDESVRYVHARLEQAGAPETTRARFDCETVAELHRRSGGNPRELNTAAASLLAPNPNQQ